ncbi:MAG: glycosyltransferase [Planctomycetaceae bacterium]
MTKTLITLCTFNERENIVELIPELHAVAPDATILVIDDNSPDGTGQLADQLSSADPRVQILHRRKTGTWHSDSGGFSIRNRQRV